jgi:cell division protein FtsW
MNMRTMAAPFPLPWRLRPPRAKHAGPEGANARRTGTATAERAERRVLVALRPTGRRTGYSIALYVTVVLLAMLGLVMVLSASAASALNEQGSSWYYFKRHAIWLAMGGAAFLVTMRIDYRLWQRLARPIFLVSVTLLTLVLLPGVGVSANGSTRWLGYGPLTVQPSELAKLALILFCADLLARRPQWTAQLTLVPVLVVLGYVSFLLMLQPNLGTTIICASIVLTILFMSGLPLRDFAPVVVLAGTAASILAVAAPYRMRRLTGFRDVWTNRGGDGYQTFQSLISVSNGGITGVGLGASRGKWGYLPFAHTDFIFSIIAEELGLVGAMTVILLFLAIGVLGLATAAHAPDRFGMLVAVGITAWILVQAFINIGVAIGVLPVTGVPLPFLSAGGSSLVVTLAAFGILVNVARHART